MKSNINKLILGSVMLATAATACTNEDMTSSGDGDKVAVKISASAATTRAVDNIWGQGDVIGITMLKAEGTDVIAPNINKSYTTADGSSNFDPAAPAEIMYFPVDGSNVTFKAYYPYSSTLSADMIAPLNVADQSSLPDLDLMTAEHLEGPSSKDHADVKLHFHHRLAKIMLDLTTEDNTISLDDCSFTVKGLKTTGTYDIMNEVLAPGDDSSIKDIPVSIHKGEGGQYTGTAIFLPREAGAGVSFEVTTKAGGVYTATLKDDVPFKGGFKHTLHINLKKTPVEVSATIEDWGEGPETKSDVVRVVTGLDASDGVTAGDTLALYLKDQAADYAYATKFTYGADGKWTTATPIYWDNIKADPAHFIGTTVIDGKLNDTQMDDILISEETPAGQYTGVNMELKHAGAKAVVAVQSTDRTFSPEELASAKITFPNYKNTGTVNEKGEFIIDETKRGDITVKDGVAIFPAQTFKAGDVIAKVNIGGRDYEIKAPKDGEYKAGAANIVNIDMHKTAVEVSTTVADWGTGSTHELTFRVDVEGKLSSGFNNEDRINFYQIGSDNTIKDTNIGTYNGNIKKGTIALDRSWYIDDFATDDKIAAIYSDKKDTDVTGGKTSFDWTTFNTTTGESNDDLQIAVKEITGNSSTNASVDLGFSHVLSKVTVNIIAGDGFYTTDFTDTHLTSVALNKLILSGTIDITKSTEIATAGNNVTDTFNPKKLTPSHTITGQTVVASYEALVMPQTVFNATTIVTVTFDGKDYSATVGQISGIAADQNLILVNGQNHTINITFKKTGISFSATATDWVPGKSGEITIQ